MKDKLCTLLGGFGAVITTLFGGWDSGITTLLIFMGVDYVSGMAVAGVFRNSPKTDSGALESRAGFKGICRKCMMLVFVVLGYRIDLIIGSSYIRDAVIIAFTANELISIVENAGLMGVKMPAVITKAIDILTTKANKEQEEK